jgi:hypothetical protein
MNAKKIKTLIIFLFLLFFLVSFSLFFYHYGFNWVVNTLHIKHTYLIGFFVCLFGGISTLSVSIYLPIMTSFVIAGSNPLLLGIIGGLGLAISDIFFFYISSKGRELIPKGRFEDFLIKLEQKFMRFGNFWVGLFIIVYVMTPFPNDILNLTLAFVRYPAKKVVRFLFIGDIVYMTAFCLFVALF